MIDSNELVLSINESVNQLNNYGVLASVFTNGEIQLKNEVAIDFYDYFQKIIDESIDRTSSMLISTFFNEENVKLRVEMEDVREINFNGLIKDFYEVQQQYEDNTLTVTITLKKEVD